MKRYPFYGFALLFIFIFFVLPPDGNAVSQGDGKRLALVIGNSDYQNGRLPNAVNDSREIKKILEQLGFDLDDSYHENLDLRKMTEAIQKFGSQLKQSGEVGLFYYAGHGFEFTGINYLLPVGTQIKSRADIEYDCYPLGRVIEEMNQANNRLNIIILDACRNNPSQQIFSRDVFGARGFSQIDAATGFYIAFATGPGQLALEKPGTNHGYFTYHLLDVLKIPKIRLDDVFVKTREKVYNDTKGEQVPWSTSSVIYDIPINSGDKVQNRSIPPPAGSKADQSYFYVYSDITSGENKFYPTGYMGFTKHIEVDSACRESPYSGETCVKITYSRKIRFDRWAGLYWQYPPDNWGSQKGHPLSGAKKIVFHAKGHKGGGTSGI